MKIIEKVFDAITGEETVFEREETAQEKAEREALENKLEQRRIEEISKANARQAILDRLGLTEEEARLLLG